MKKKILVVDDSLNLRSSLNRFLGVKYEVILAENGQECLDILEKREDIDLLIMDVNMPVMDGIQAVHEISKSSNIGEVQTIMLTTETSGKKKAELLKYKFVRCWIIKPITQDLIVATVDKILAR